jgi:hypothetical protein
MSKKAAESDAPPPAYAGFVQLLTAAGPVWVRPDQVSDVCVESGETHVHLANTRCYKVSLAVDDVMALLV